MRTPTLAVLLFLFVLAIVGPLIQPYADQQASRYALTAAIWDNHALDLDGLEQVVGRDAAYKDGHLYSDKAPLQPFLAVPFYAIYRSVGGEPAANLRLEENLGLWWESLWFAAIPLAAIAMILFGLAKRVDRTVALPAALAVTLGTILLPFGALLFGHVLAALFMLGSVYLIFSRQMDPVWLLGAGALAGAAVATEYQAAVGVGVLSVAVLYRAKWKSVWFLLGGLPFAILLGWYHTAVFGSPLSHPYRYNVIRGVVDEQKPLVFKFARFRLGNLFDILFSGRGFLIASPIVILGVIGLVYLIRRRSGSVRSDAMISLAVFAALFMVPVFWANPWGGASPGPRYLVPALPLIVTGVAAAWRFRPLMTRLVVGISVATMLLAAVTNPLILPGEPGGIGTWIGLASNGDFVDTIFTMAMGNWGWVVHVTLVAALGWLLRREWRRSLQPSVVG